MFYHVLEGCQSGTLVQCDELDYRMVLIEQEKDIDYVPHVLPAFFNKIGFFVG